MNKRRIILYAILIMCMSAALASIFTERALRLQGKEQGKILSADGWRKSRVGSEKDLLEIAPDVDVGALVAAKVPPILSGRVVTEAEAFYLPVECPPAAPPPGGTGQGRGPEVAPPAPDPLFPKSATPLLLSVEGQFVAGLTAGDNNVYIKGRFWADLERGSWSERRELTLGPGSEIVVSRDLQKALSRGVRDRRHLDFRVGVTTEPGLEVGASYFPAGKRWGRYISVGYAKPDIRANVDYFATPGDMRVTLGLTRRFMWP